MNMDQNSTNDTPQQSSTVGKSQGTVPTDSPVYGSKNDNSDGQTAGARELNVPTNSNPNYVDMDLNAEDVDLIEKEWVMKAKAIVEGTRNDPHEQNLEISKIKADYIKKRYNKDLKVME